MTEAKVTTLRQVINLSSFVYILNIFLLNFILIMTRRTDIEEPFHIHSNLLTRSQETEYKTPQLHDAAG